MAAGAQVRSDILDWHGDHPATNYHEMYDALRDGGYFLEILGSPLSCFDATQVCNETLIAAIERPTLKPKESGGKRLRRHPAWPPPLLLQPVCSYKF